MPAKRVSRAEMVRYMRLNGVYCIHCSAEKASVGFGCRRKACACEAAIIRAIKGKERRKK